MRVRTEVRVCRARALKVIGVNTVAESFDHFSELRLRATGPVRQAQADHPTYQVWPHERCMPRYFRAPIVTDDHTFFLIESIQQLDDVANQMHNGVLFHGNRMVTLAIPALIHRYRSKPGLGKGRNLMAPRIPHLGKAVQEQNQRPSAGFGDMQADVTRLNKSMRNGGHCY